MQKQKSFGTLLFIIAAITILSVACSKTGPTGPAGATGPAGPQGSTGLQGAQGPQGNANVHVDVFTVSNSQWLWEDYYIFFTGSGSYTEWFTRYYKAAFSAVTQGVLDSGMVLVYMTPNLNDLNQWSPLPYIFDTGSGYSYNFVYVTGPGTVELEFYFDEANGSNAAPTLSTFVIESYKFKIIAVTGSMVTSMQKNQIDKGNYAQVANFLGL
jgi:hypothetical protein